MSTERIPLFPLAIVLLPHSQVPLHIFEDRYKRMINECMEKGEAFGINFIEDSKLHSIGCTARVAEVVKRYPDGQLDIITEGIDRYQIVSVDNSDPNDLLYAQVKWITDKEEPRDTELAGEAINLFNELCEVAYNGTIDSLDISEWIQDDKLPSFVIAQKSGLEPDQRQALLGITSENERLSILRNFLSQLVPKVKEIEKTNDLIRNDGYIPTWNRKK